MSLREIEDHHVQWILLGLKEVWYYSTRSTIFDWSWIVKSSLTCLHSLFASSSLITKQFYIIYTTGFTPAQLLLNQKVWSKLSQDVHRKNDEAKAKMKVHVDTQFKVKPCIKDWYWWFGVGMSKKTKWFLHKTLTHYHFI